MLKISRLFKKSTAFALLLTVGMTAASVSPVFAAGTTPTTSTATTAAQGLQANWKSEVASFNSESQYVGQIEQRLTKDSGGNEFFSGDNESRNLSTGDARRLKDAQKVLGMENSIIQAHTGFDANGNVTDQTQATQAVQQLGSLVDEFNGQIHYMLKNIS